MYKQDLTIMMSLATELVMSHLRDRCQQYAATMHVGSSDPSFLAALHCTSDTGALVLVLSGFADSISYACCKIIHACMICSASFWRRDYVLITDLSVASRA